MPRKVTTISISLPIPLVEEIGKVAQAEDLSKSQVMRRAFEQWLKLSKDAHYAFDPRQPDERIILPPTVTPEHLRALANTLEEDSGDGSQKE